MTIRQMYHELNNILGMLQGTVGKENPLVQFLENLALVLDALAIRYPSKDMTNVIDMLHDDAHEVWEKSEKAKEALKNDSAH